MKIMERFPVETYRLYIKDSFDRHIEDCIDIEAVNDEDAVRVARRCRDCRPSELWLRSRVVRRFPREEFTTSH